MAAVAGNSVHCWMPPLKPSFYQNHSFLPAKAGQSIHTINTQTQKVSPFDGPDQLRDHCSQSKSAAPATFAHSRLQAEADGDTTARAKDHNRASIYSNNELGDEYVPTVKILQTPFPTKALTNPSKPERNHQYLDKPASEATSIQIDHTRPGLGDHQGRSHDQPVIIEDDESDNTDAEAETITSANAEFGSSERDTSPRRTSSNQDPTSESSAPVDTSGPNILYDVEGGRYVDKEEFLPSLGLRKQEGSTPLTPAQHHHRSLRQSSKPSLDQIDRRNASGITRQTSEQPTTQSPLEPLREGGDGWSVDALTELEKEVELALEDQEKSSSTSSPNSEHPPHSIEPSHDKINRRSQSEITRRRPEERRGGSRLDTPDVGEEERLQQEAEVVADVDMLQAKWQQEEEMAGVLEGMEIQGLQQQQNEEDGLAGEEEELDELAMEEPEEREEEDDMDNPEDKDYSRDTGDEGDEDNEVLRPAKRQRLSSQRSDKVLEAPREYGAKLGVRRPRRLSSPLSVQVETDDVQSQTQWSTFIDNKQHDTQQPSRNSSATGESVPTAEYQEWPLHGFFKRIRIGKETIFNLDFHLTHLPEDLELSVAPEALDSSYIKTSAHSAVAHSKTRRVASWHPTKRAQWTSKEDAILVRMKKEDNCSWEEISAALPSRSPGAIQVRYSTKFKSGASGSRKH